jgi:transcriptional regulator with XRE-family HTH domain
MNGALSLDVIRACLQDRKLRQVAKATGLHYNTLWKIRQGRAKRPSADVIFRLSRYLTAIPPITNESKEDASRD